MRGNIFMIINIGTKTLRKFALDYYYYLSMVIKNNIIFKTFQNWTNSKLRHYFQFFKLSYKFTQHFIYGQLQKSLNIRTSAVVNDYNK